MATNNNLSTKFAPKSHFFTDPTVLTQTAAQSHGPESESEYKLTSNFTIAANTMAFAICTGMVLVQPQVVDDTKVNLILRPLKQPATGLNIKYFIYRGLRKADFFNGDKVISATTSTSQFVNNANASFAAFHNLIDPGTDLPDFLSKYIGYDPINQNGSLPLSNFFFKQAVYTDVNGNIIEDSGTAFELPLMNIGASLGNFASGECGIDIVLNYGDYQSPQPNYEFVFDLNYARSAKAVVNLSSITDDFVKKVTREQIFQFLDVAAYFGFHCDGGVVTVNVGGVETDRTGDAIYTDIVQKFDSKNKIYLYIQSDRTRSYNFYGNYTIDGTENSSLKIGSTANSLTAAAYETNGWPVIISNAAQANSDTRNTICLQFVTDNNNNAMLYGYMAQIDDAEGNNFCDADNLQPADDDDASVGFTRVIQLSNPATGPVNARLNVANFNILIYYGKVYDYVIGQTSDANGATVNETAQPDFFDDVFDCIEATPLLKSNNVSAYSSLTSQRLKLVNHYYDDTQYGISAVQTTIVNDVLNTGDTTTPQLNRVIYITEAVDVLSNVIAVAGPVTSDTKSMPSVSGAVTNSNTYQLPTPFYYDWKTFTDGTQTISGLELKTTDNSIPSKIILGLSGEENDSLKELVNVNGLINAELFFTQLTNNGRPFISSEGLSYQKYKIGVSGESSSGELNIMTSVPEIIAYTLDGQYYFSKVYSDYTLVDSEIPDNDLLLDVRP